jgi:hypothetical protein
LSESSTRFGEPKLPPSHRTRVLILAAVLIILGAVCAPGTTPSDPPRPTRPTRVWVIGAGAAPRGGVLVQAADQTFARPDFYEPDPESDLGPDATGAGVALDPPAPWTARPVQAILSDRPGAPLHLRC